MSACPPVNCCCLGDVLVKRGEITQVTVDWSAWLSSNPGFNLFSITNIQLLDLNLPLSPPALLTLLDLVPTLASIPVPPDTWFRINKMQSLFTLQVFPATPVNSYYRLNFTAIARNCDGLQISRTECLIIRIVDCY